MSRDECYAIGCQTKIRGVDSSCDVTRVTSVDFPRKTDFAAQSIDLLGITDAVNKADIIQEIRRTAESNGGIPLGMRKFQSETGIKSSDWQGKLWARWSEALHEAGFVPNQLRSAYDSAELLGKYATLAQELGRLPTANDLRLKARADPDFPNHNAFDRFGSKLQLVQVLLQYCSERTDYEDLVGLCEAYVPPKHVPVKNDAPEDEQIGFVYLIKSGRFYKIGKSNAAGRREYELSIQLPERAKTIHVIRTDDPTGIEVYWHKRFEAKRKNGEWFELNAADVAAFKRRKFM